MLIVLIESKILKSSWSSLPVGRTTLVLADASCASRWSSTCRRDAGALGRAGCTDGLAEGALSATSGESRPFFLHSQTSFLLNKKLTLAASRIMI